MNIRSSSLVADGLSRLLHSPEFRAKRKAIETEVREEHAVELSSAKDFWQRASVESKIKREIHRRTKSITPSPYALWHSG
jgi:hypothetical protein